eukprot:c4585_g1_i1.p1 GENE.c4585_g1_i1~~c4585_g1_i1.p1  ORF type:complete len:221 (+),score=76.36 c4585_g1_i1:71-733(+)
MQTFVPSGRSVSEPVVLNVYDLTPVNDNLYCMGLGFYHSGVVIYGSEYSFGGGDIGGSGVFRHKPKDIPYTVRATISLGTSNLTSSQVDDVIHELSKYFLANSYSPILLNCNHFSNEFSKRICGKGIPGFVNRMAFIGQYFQCLFPAEMIKSGPSVAPQKIQQPPQLFQGQGVTLASSSATTNSSSNTKKTESNETAEEKRSRIAKAIENRMTNKESHNE